MINDIDNEQWLLLRKYLADYQIARVEELLKVGWVIENTVLTDKGPTIVKNGRIQGRCISPTLRNGNDRFKFPVLPIDDWDLLDQDDRDRWAEEFDRELFAES